MDRHPATPAFITNLAPLSAEQLIDHLTYSSFAAQIGYGMDFLRAGKVLGLTVRQQYDYERRYTAERSAANERGPFVLPERDGMDADLERHAAEHGTGVRKAWD